jgi:integrase
MSTSILITGFVCLSLKSGILHKACFLVNLGLFYPVATIFATIYLHRIKEKFDMQKSKHKFPYEEARLISSGKRPYIEFKCWNIKTGSLQTCREWAGFSKCKTPAQLQAVASPTIKILNDALRSGYYIQGSKEETSTTEDITKRKLTTREAFDYVLNHKENVQKLKPKTLEKYNDVKNEFLFFLKKNLPGLLDARVKEISKYDIQRFYEHLAAARTGEETTTNTFKVIFKAIFSCLVENHKLKKNPCPKNKKIKSKSTKNTAFNKEQTAKLKKEIKQKDPALFIFINWMFYTFARPEELRLLKIEDINIELEKITVNNRNSKNGIERIVEISPHLLPIIKKMKLEKYPGEYYVFGKSLKKGGLNLPAAHPVGKNHYYERHKKFMERVRVNKDLTLYSWKHTGVCYHKLAGVDDAALKEQGGWQDWISFYVYLKSLKVIDNTRFKKFSPAL